MKAVHRLRVPAWRTNTRTAGSRTDRLARTPFLTLLAAVGLIVPVLNLAVPADSAFHISNYAVTLIGKYLCFAMLALAVDLVWGFCGILSLGHAAFFALGG
jgi:urea transport system permease protein